MYSIWFFLVPQPSLRSVSSPHFNILSWGRNRKTNKLWRYGDGVLGGIVIDGPATANYDEDLGIMMVQDWYYRTAFQNAISSQTPGVGIPVADNGLINGTMVNAQGGGQYYTTTLQRNRRYRLRFVNTSVDNHFKVQLDSHLFTVITSDFVPIVPYETDWLFVGIGMFGFPQHKSTPLESPINQIRCRRETRRHHRN